MNTDNMNAVEGWVKDAEKDPTIYLQTGAELQTLEIKIEWLVEDLIPVQSITTLVGPAGYGKTTVCLNIAHAIDQGMPWLGHETQQSPVYVLDYENPLPVLVSRARDLRLENVQFWHSTAEIPPPKIDSEKYEMYKHLPPGLLIVDGHRASQSGDENSSKDTNVVMNNWKELRNLGFTVLLIHHTTKANSEQFRGSQALEDQADHCLYFYPVKKPGSDDPADIDADTAVYFLGTKTKTRYQACRMYLKRAGEGRFILAENPDEENLIALRDLLSRAGQLNQTEFLKLARDELGIKSAKKLLDSGLTKGFWEKQKGDKNASLFRVCSVLPPIKGGKTEKQDYDSYVGDTKHTTGCQSQNVDAVEFVSFSHPSNQTGKTGYFDTSLFPVLHRCEKDACKTEFCPETSYYHEVTL